MRSSGILVLSILMATSPLQTTAMATETMPSASPSVSPLAGLLPSKNLIINSLLPAAKQGNRAAQCAIGWDYMYGWGVGKDQAQGFAWLLRSAQQGYAEAEDQVGMAYETGSGTAQDIAQAVQWFEKAADQNQAKAIYHLGSIYLHGKLGHTDYERALYWFKRGVDEEDPGCQNALGYMYLLGLGTPKDTAAALKLFQRSAEQGNSWAQANMGEIYRTGEYAPIDKVSSLMWYSIAAQKKNPDGLKYSESLQGQMSPAQIAEAESRVGKWCKSFPKRYQPASARDALDKIELAALAGNTASMVWLGFLYESGYGFGLKKSEKEAERWYRLAAESGDANGMLALGLLLAKPDAQGKRHGTEAIAWLTKAFDNDQSMAAFHLANLYEQGQAIPKDESKAFHWYQIAATLDDAGAACKVGMAYLDGHGAPRDPLRASQWFLQGANEWDAAAQYQLGLLYEKGKGVKPSLVESLKWLELAADTNFGAADAEIATLKKQMTVAEVARAEQAKVEWLKMHPLKFIDLDPDHRKASIPATTATP